MVLHTSAAEFSFSSASFRKSCTKRGRFHFVSSPLFCHSPLRGPTIGKTSLHILKNPEDFWDSEQTESAAVPATSLLSTPEMPHIS